MSSLAASLFALSLPMVALASPLIPRQSGLTVCSSSPTSYAESCSSSSVSNACCTNSPGGHLLLTQFFDTNPPTGPSDAWTLHGLWPDNCDGTFDASCDSSREVSSVSSVLKSFGETSLLSYMNTYWLDQNGDNDSFWVHEFNKHGTCISSLKPSCLTTYKTNLEVVYFAKQAVALYKTLPTYSWLSAAGIVPSTTTTYTLSQIQGALQAKFGGGVNVNCAGSTFNEVWYHYTTRGSAVDGVFDPAALVGSKSTCPSTGIKYVPKSTTSSGGGTGTGTTAGSGTLYAVGSSGSAASGTCIISDGSWYAAGSSCATITSTSVSGGYTLKSSKGNCAVSGGIFTCASGLTASVFSISSAGTLSLSGSSAFSASSTPSGTTKVPVYQGSSKSISLTLKFTS